MTDFGIRSDFIFDSYKSRDVSVISVKPGLVGASSEKGSLVFNPSDDMVYYGNGLMLQSLTGGGDIQASFVYRPDGMPPMRTDDIYNDWTMLMADVNDFAGKRFITIDDTIISPAVVPAGVWDMTNVILRGSATTSGGGGERHELEISDGATLPNLALVTDWLLIISESTSPVLNLGSGLNSRLELDNNACLVSRNGAPFILVNGTSRIILRDQSIFERAGAGGNEVVVEYVAGASGSIRMGDRGRLLNNVIRTDATVSINVVWQATSATLGNQPQDAGGIVEILRPAAERVAYDNAVSGLVAVEVQSAIDEIAGAAGGDVSGTGSSTDNAIVRWDGGTGTMVQDSAAFVDDTGVLTSDNYKRGIGIPLFTAGDAGDLYQRFSGSGPGLFINVDGANVWKKINVMENITFIPSDMSNVGGPQAATLTTRNGRPVVSFIDPINLAAEREVIFQGYLPTNYNVGATIRYEILYATTAVVAGFVAFNISWERLEPNVTDIDIDNFLLFGTVPTAVGGPAGTVQVSTNVMVPAQIGNAPPGEGFRLRIRRVTADTVADVVDILRVALYEQEQ